MALRFDNAAVHPLAAMNFVSNGAWTVAARCYVTTASAANFIYITENGSFTNSIWLGINNGVSELAMFFTVANISWSWPGPSPLVALGVWFHIALTYNGTDRLVWYYDGAVGQDTTDPALGTLTPTLPNFQSANVGFGSDFTCQDIALWNRALTAPEIVRLSDYQRVAGTLASSQYFWLPMNVGNAYADYTGNGHTLASGADEVSGDPGVPWESIAGQGLVSLSGSGQISTPVPPTAAARKATSDRRTQVTRRRVR